MLFVWDLGGFYFHNYWTPPLLSDVSSLKKLPDSRNHSWQKEQADMAWSPAKDTFERGTQ